MFKLFLAVFAFLAGTYIVLRLKFVLRDFFWGVGELHISVKTSVKY